MQHRQKSARKGKNMKKDIDYLKTCDNIEKELSGFRNR